VYEDGKVKNEGKESELIINVKWRRIEWGKSVAPEPKAEFDGN